MSSKTSTSVSFDLPTDVPRLVQAASLTLAILSYVKKLTLQDLQHSQQVGDRIVLERLSHISLSDHEVELLDDPDIYPILSLIRAKISVKDKRDTPRTIAVCPKCDEWLMASSAPLGKCMLTLECPGKPIKATRAKRRKD